MVALNRHGDAKAILQDAKDRHLDFIGARDCRIFSRSSKVTRPRWRTNYKASIGVGAKQRGVRSGRGMRAFAGGSSPLMSTPPSIQMALQGNFGSRRTFSVEDAELHATVRQALSTQPGGSGLDLTGTY